MHFNFSFFFRILCILAGFCRYTYAVDAGGMEISEQELLGMVKTGEHVDFSSAKLEEFLGNTISESEKLPNECPFYRESLTSTIKNLKDKVFESTPVTERFHNLVSSVEVLQATLAEDDGDLLAKKLYTLKWWLTNLESVLDEAGV